jgi:uncharacterized Ntn-hydrolase superfamily protein
LAWLDIVVRLAYHDVVTTQRVTCSEFAQIVARGQGMYRCILLVALSLWWIAPAAAGSPLAGSVQRPVHTYSIVARDPLTGQLGVAVQSHWFSVGDLVPWVRAGVGAVATQSFIDVRYGVEGLQLMRQGKSAGQALELLLKADATPGVRQVGIIDAQGGVAQHTGENCIQHAGHLAGDNFAVQANLMVHEGVPEAMAKAFRAASGPLAARLLAALEAAQALGGDLRGKQSAAIVVVRAEPAEHAWQERLVNLHIEDHPTPLLELRRLLTLNSVYHHMNLGEHALEKDDLAAALTHYGTAEALAPDNREIRFWHAVALLNAGKAEAALPVITPVLVAGEEWLELLRRLVDAGILKTDEQTLQQIYSAAPARQEVK